MAGVHILINEFVDIETQERVSTSDLKFKHVSFWNRFGYNFTQMKRRCDHQAHLMVHKSTDYRSYPVQI